MFLPPYTNKRYKRLTWLVGRKRYDKFQTLTKIIGTTKPIKRRTGVRLVVDIERIDHDGSSGCGVEDLILRSNSPAPSTDPNDCRTSASPPLLLPVDEEDVVSVAVAAPPLD